MLETLDFIRAVPEVERRLADDMSRKIYKMRMDYAIYRDIKKLRESISNLNLSDNWMPNLSKFIAKNNPQKIVIFGAGYWGKKTLNILRKSKYNNLSFVFCDNNPNGLTKVRQGGVLT